ncbi:MAG: ExbD/TolR family protein [Planctomycetaceae bacterium]
MRVPTAQRQLGLRFNITPLIDVVFLLIIFFMVASHFVRSQSLEAVELPEATPAEVESDTPRRMVITITSDGRLLVGAREVEPEELERLVLAAGAEAEGSDLEVRIRGDRTVPYEEIEPILLACARAGITNVKFAVLPK